MADRMVKSFEDAFKEWFQLEEFSSDAYVEHLVKSGKLGDALSKAAGGVYYNGYTGRPSDTYAGYPNIGTQYSDLTPLRIQNLDATLTTVLFKRRNFVLWDWLQKVPTISTLYEYDKVRSYGTGRAAAGFSEGGIPSLSLPRYERDQATVRYLGVQRGVTQQSRMVGRAGGLMMDPVRAEVENGTLNLLEKLTRQLYFGNQLILDEAGATVNFDGITRQVAAQNDPDTVIDLQGDPNKFSFSLFDNIANTLVERGYVTDFANVNCFMNPQVLTDLSKLYYVAGAGSATNANFAQIQRIMNQTGRNQQYIPGAPIGGYDTNFGHFRFTPDLMFQEVQSNTPVTDPSATVVPADPGAPSGAYLAGLDDITVAETHTVAQTGSLPSVPAGSYYYWLSAVGTAGESAPVAINGGSVLTFTATTGYASKVTLTQGSTGGIVGGYAAGGPVAYRLYRSTMSNPWSGSSWIDPNGGLVGTFPQLAVTPTAGDLLSEDVVGTVGWVDDGSIVPGTGNILILEGSTENIQVPQLTPLLKYNLPPVGTLEPFLLLIYLTVIYKAQKRAFWIRNIPRLA